MMHALLAGLERRTNRVFWSDGLLDLFCAVALLAIGASWLAERVVLGAIAPGLLIPWWTPIRRRFTERRLGRVELADERQQRNRRFTVLMILAGALSLLFGVGMLVAHRWGLAPSKLLVEAMPGGLVGIAGIATAEALQLRRFFLYGGLCFATGVGVAFAPSLNPGWAFVVGGSAALVGGLVLVRRFVRDHPPASPTIGIEADA